MKYVAIFGAGVGGLTVAHELSKLPNYKIDLFEKKNDVGGLARSSRDTDLCAQEYCWRVYFDFYNNIFKLFSEIPLIEDNNKTVLNNLTIYKHVNVLDSNFSIKDKLLGLYSVMYGLTSCDRRIDELDNLSWWNALGTSSKSNLFREIGGWLGMDRFKGSYRSVIKVGIEMQILPNYITNDYNDWITTKPTSEAWFDHWIYHLNNKGVNIHTNTELQSIEIANNKIISATVYDKLNKQSKKIIADYYVFSIPVEVFSKIIEVTPELYYGDLKNIKTLAHTCLHMQLSFQVYFNKPILLGTSSKTGSNNAFLVVDSPWDLIVLLYDQAYIGTNLCSKIPQVRGGWSIAACTAYMNGIVFNKPMNKCSYEEIIIEIWTQLKNSQKLQKLIKKNNGFYLTDNLVVKWAPMWSSYNFDKNSQTLQTSEPKFTNNAGSFALRPSFKTHIDNLYIATAYIRETIDIFSMEAAAIAGKLTANSISNQLPKPIYQQRPPLFAPFRSIDNIFYTLNLPNYNPWLMIFFFVFVIILLFVIIVSIGK